jgi:hypothetical protein
MKRSTGVLRTGDRVYVTASLPIRPTTPGGTAVLRTVSTVTRDGDDVTVVMTDGFRCTTHRGTAWHVA